VAVAFGRVLRVREDRSSVVNRRGERGRLTNARPIGRAPATFTVSPQGCPRSAAPSGSLGSAHCVDSNDPSFQTVRTPPCLERPASESRTRCYPAVATAVNTRWRPRAPLLATRAQLSIESVDSLVEKAEGGESARLSSSTPLAPAGGGRQLQSACSTGSTDGRPGLSSRNYLLRVEKTRIPAHGGTLPPEAMNRVGI
jgi:hypothetical protein